MIPNICIRRCICETVHAHLNGRCAKVARVDAALQCCAVWKGCIGQYVLRLDNAVDGTVCCPVAIDPGDVHGCGRTRRNRNEFTSGNNDACGPARLYWRQCTTKRSRVSHNRKHRSKPNHNQHSQEYVETMGGEAKGH